MPLKDQIVNSARKLIETGPDPSEMDRALRARKPRCILFEDDGIVPNHPRWPLLLYRDAIRLDARNSAAMIDAVFARNGWRRSWRDTIYDFVHYHSQIHEVLGVAKGTAVVECGGINGAKFEVKAGDVLVLPAGTGHRLIDSSRNFPVVGAYPQDGVYDECTDTRDRTKAVKRIAKTKRPSADPLYGRRGPLTTAWRRR
ncbi:MAG: cupin domain-containing protein [Xanthobacteraceae bacterium]